jgi:S1-C subfamily serine protease
VLDTGKLLRPYLGVRYVQLTDDYAYELDLETKRGAYILPGRDGRPSILPNSPAMEAGLKEGDIITEVNGVGIDEKHSLVSLIGSHKVGDKVTLTIVRDGREQTVEATLEASPE